MRLPQIKFLAVLFLFNFSLILFLSKLFDGEENRNTVGVTAPLSNPVDPFAVRQIDPILVKSLAKVSGPRSNIYDQENQADNFGWDVDPKTILESNLNKVLECKWLDFVSTTGNTAKFCGHSNGDYVTRMIEKKKRFGDCDILSRLWNEATNKTQNSVYLEIGANIGSCVMEMLLSTDAKIVAFEPHPHNQFVLQSTIQALDPSYQKRFVLVPVALGKETSKNQIYASPRNMGNSVVGKVIKDYGKQKTTDFENFEINIERLSSILDADAGVDFPLVKMDAQGFECQVLDGIDLNLIGKIYKIKFEIAPKWLSQQNCLNLLSKLRNLGYEIMSEAGIIIEGEASRWGEALAVQKK